MAQEPRDHQLAARIPRRIYAALEARADAERRTVSDVLNNILAEIFPVPSKDKARRG